MKAVDTDIRPERTSRRRRRFRAAAAELAGAFLSGGPDVLCALDVFLR